MKMNTLWFLTCLFGGPLYPTAPALADDLKSGPEIEFERVIDSIKHNDLSSEEIRTIRDFEKLTVIDLNGIEGRDRVQVLQRTLRRMNDGWAEIQTALMNNPVLRRELERRSVDINRVVAATRDEAGQIAIFLR